MVADIADLPGEDRDIKRLLERVFLLAGYDFRDYAPAVLRRRIHALMRAENIPSVTWLSDRIIQDTAIRQRFVRIFSVGVTSMFRDPDFYVALREKVLPVLRTYPFTRIWHAGCSTGEEVYSMAILLQEAGLYHRCKIYATDMSEPAVNRARQGIFPLSAMRGHTRNYIQAGGTRAFSDYYTALYGNAIFHRSLKENMVFGQHNLAHDGPFNEFNVVLCRNVLIYFNRTLQARVHDLLHDSLVPLGFLGLGGKETLAGSPQEKRYKEIDRGERIYRRVA